MRPSTPNLSHLFSSIKIYDELLTDEMLHDVIELITSKGFHYGWKSSKNVSFSHWNLGLSKTGQASGNRKDITQELPDCVKTLWNQIQPIILKEHPILLRAYCNAYTYGTDGYIHQDSKFEEDMTLIIYLNQSWNPNWGGETVLFHDNEIFKAVLPKFKRLFLFPAAMDHAARGVSRWCPQVRQVLVFKATKQ